MYFLHLILGKKLDIWGEMWKEVREGGVEKCVGVWAVV